MGKTLENTPITANSGAHAASIPQYSIARVLGVWATAAFPMGLAAWLLAPALAGMWPDDAGFAQALLISLTLGLIWQAVVVVASIYREQGTLRWPVIREALWLPAPYDPRRKQRSLRVWWMLIPAGVMVVATEAIPKLPIPASHNLSLFVQSDAGRAFFHGNWVWFSLVVVMSIFNTVLGEELLFRGLLLPRMQAAFGKGAWLTNAILFTLYHLHQPWGMPTSILHGLVFSYATQRYRTAWFGIILHSLASIWLTVLLLMLVLK